ncbi:unnamed protein product [Rhizophagus irregularis]|nr:unnamed protein product [Rhizophagus irregularis]
MQQELFSPFLNNLEKLFKSKKDYDVIIKAGEDNDQKEIYAHSNILRCQSDYFDTAFSSNWAEKKDGKYIFKKPNVLPHIFEIIIRYFYCGQLDLNVKNGPDTLKLLVATDELGLNILSEYIQEFLIKNQKKFLQNDPIGILEVAFQHETFTMLRDYGLEAICEEPNILFGTDKILSLPAQILESLLKQDDLVLDEIEFHFVPQAKQIGSLPSRNAVNTIDSVLINSEHLAIFAGWIDKKDESLKMIPYEFNLILRASRDGNTAGAFHDKCDNKGATIIVVKIEETNQIVGGYNPLDWEGSDICKNTQDSFIFIFDNYRDINTGRIGRVTDASHALVCSNRWGPIFGNGHDLSMNCVGKWVSRGSSTYSYLGIPYDFANDDYEVFQ